MGNIIFISTGQAIGEFYGNCFADIRLAHAQTALGEDGDIVVDVAI